MAAPLIVAGRGKVGRSLARALKAVGHPARLVAARDGTKRLVRALASEPQAIVFVAVPDAAVPAFARVIAADGGSLPGTVGFVHVSGALGLEALEPLAARHAVGAFHPLRSFPRPQPPAAFKGIVVAIEANRPALARRLAQIARDLGARPRTVGAEDRILYHAAAVFASNYGVALLGVAASLLEQIGWSEKEAVAGLLPLMEGALAEAGRIGVAGALTGPVRRGDPATIERHLAALERLRRRSPEPPVVDLYRMLGAIALEIAREAGGGHEREQGVDPQSGSDPKETASMTTVLDVQRFKDEGRRFAMLTAYDYLSARILDEAGIPILLVGDSLGMVMLGYPTTLPVTLDEMVHHAKAVARGSRQALLIGDMPFMSYHLSTEQAIASAGRFLQEAGMHAVKLEGGGRVVEITRRLTEIGIPVMGHLGLTPQFVHQMGGFKVQGKTEAQAGRIMADAKELEQAGAFSLVLEGVPSALAGRISKALRIPTIGIGAGPQTDGQVLVFHDVMGLTTGKAPRFVKRYANLADDISRAAHQFSEDVRTGAFPDPDHSYSANGSTPDAQPAHEEAKYGAG